MNKLSLVLIVLLAFSCKKEKAENKKVDKKTIEFNDLAVEQIQKRNGDSALYFINRSVEIDSNYFLAQYNKLTILWGLKRNEEALMVAKKISELGHFQNLSLEGMAYERIGDFHKAKELYKTTVDQWPKQALDSSYDVRLEYARLGTVVYGKDFGIKEINKIDTSKLGSMEVHMINLVRTSIENYHSEGYDDLLYSAVKQLNNSNK